MPPASAVLQAVILKPRRRGFRQVDVALAITAPLYRAIERPFLKATVQVHVNAAMDFRHAHRPALLPQVSLRVGDERAIDDERFHFGAACEQEEDGVSHVVAVGIGSVGGVKSVV